MAIPQNNPSLCGLSWATKVIASGVFITGREPHEIFRRSCNWMAAPDEMLSKAFEDKDPSGLMALDPVIEVNREERWVSVTLNGETAWAKGFGDQGFCVVDGPEADCHFDPAPINPRPPAGTDWPDTDPVEVDPGATGADIGKLDEALGAIFGNPYQFTNAAIVLHKGKVIAERYRDPFDRETQFESWSMGKSIASTLVGIAIKEGHLELDETGVFEEWSSPNDPRREISVRNILNMASGLSFTGSYGANEDHAIRQQDGLYLDHIYVYASGTDSYEFCVNKPLTDAPDTAGRYRNCDPLLATALVRQRAAGGDVQAFLDWPQKKLYDEIGSTGMVLETDPYGHFLISGHDYGRAMDWARLGQLHLQRGAWGGKQLFSEEFAEFVRTPAEKAWAHDPYYGGFFCTNATGIIPTLPKDAYWMSGGGRQRVMIVPSQDLVMVRLGHIAGFAFGIHEALDEHYRLVLEAIS